MRERDCLDKKEMNVKREERKRKEKKKEKGKRKEKERKKGKRKWIIYFIINCVSQIIRG
jgi:hypothetical protein